MKISYKDANMPKVALTIGSFCCIVVLLMYHTFLLQDCLISSTSSSLLSISFECVCLSLSISISRRSLACRSQHQHLIEYKSTPLQMHMQNNPVAQANKTPLNYYYNVCRL